MSKTKKIVLIVACVVVGVGLIVSGIGLYSLGFDFRELETYKLQTRVYELEEDFTTLHVDMRTADLILLPAQDNKTKVVCLEKENEPHTVLVADGALKIQTENHRKWYDYIGFGFGGQEVTVYLPKSEYAKITVEMNTGDISVAKDFSFGQVKITVDTGDVVWSAGVGESLAIETDTGDIEVRSLSSEAVMQFTSDTGDMDIFDITCKTLKMKTDTGDLELDKITVTESAGIQATTGDLELEGVLVGNTLSIQTTTGDVEIGNSDAETIKIVTNTGDVEGVLLSDKIFVAKTDTGKVDVPKTTSGGVCEVNTDTGDIQFRIKK